MIPTPLPGRDTLLVGSETLYRNNFLTLSQVFGLHRRIGHEDQYKQGIHHGKQATEEEDNLCTFLAQHCDQ